MFRACVALSTQLLEHAKGDAHVGDFISSGGRGGLGGGRANVVLGARLPNGRCDKSSGLTRRALEGSADMLAVSCGSFTGLLGAPEENSSPANWTV